ncbi:uncharacterized protein BO72DRAFT_248614 [Aspergillus fijiensis CBS 313.89]|uniref:Uncharacterized protein n=1 Tax=Aspergillus fijiensis CBS 313.89 TaxID=1448319 RepID=A0A8G1RH00_9EURO|nr:uncharacterized protein BO72DRAFT_248614 [Aspergillus fijiensis CBS 313.89]RAK73160.1 hypothetical protein BO72DRAFT_248614 [Aspergillus fijiensis CBS 313.89]
MDSTAPRRSEPYTHVWLASTEAKTSYILDDLHIPHVIWGDSVFGYLGLQLTITSADYVIEDEFFAVAVEALSTLPEGLDFCCQAPDPNDATSTRTAPPCPWHPHPRPKGTLIPDAHFIVNDKHHLHLYRKSRLLWWIPRLQERGGDDGDSLYMCTCDSLLPTPRATAHRGGPGRGPADLASTYHPVYMLKPHVYAAALVFLVVRNVGHEIEAHWDNELDKMAAAMAACPPCQQPNVPCVFLQFLRRREDSYVSLTVFAALWRRLQERMPPAEGEPAKNYRRRRRWLEKWRP